jgi:hypothetical protein
LATKLAHVAQTIRTKFQEYHCCQGCCNWVTLISQNYRLYQSLWMRQERIVCATIIVLECVLMETTVPTRETVGM